MCADPPDGGRDPSSNTWKYPAWSDVVSNRLDGIRPRVRASAESRFVPLACKECFLAYEKLEGRVGEGERGGPLACTRHEASSWLRGILIFSYSDLHSRHGVHIKGSVQPFVRACPCNLPEGISLERPTNLRWVRMRHSGVGLFPDSFRASTLQPETATPSPKKVNFI